MTTFNNIFSSGQGVLPVSSGGTGGSTPSEAQDNLGIGWVKIGEPTVVSSAVSSVEFDLPSGYQNYKLAINGLQSATDLQYPWIRFSSDGGSTWLGSGGGFIYRYRIARIYTDITYQGGTGNSVGYLSVGQIRSGSDDSFSCEVDIEHAASTTIGTTYRVYGTRHEGNGLIVTELGSGARNSAAADNAVQIFMTSGNIAAGTFTLYGLK